MPNDAAHAIAIPLDDAGNPISLINVVTICPAEHIAEGRNHALAFMQQCMQSGDSDASRMLPDALSPDGTGTPTHFMCERIVNPKESLLQLEYMLGVRSSGVDWFCETPFMLVHDPEELRQKFGQFDGETDAILNHLSLRRIA